MKDILDEKELLEPLVYSEKVVSQIANTFIVIGFVLGVCVSYLIFIIF